MTEPVKSRRYDMSLRAQRTEDSKRAVVAAAHELFLARGFVDTTVDAISAASRVPIATVYRLFKTKTAILKQVIDTAVVGDDAPVPLGDRPIVRDAQAAEDAKAMTAAFAHVARQVFDNTAELRIVLRAAAAVDPDAAALNDSIEDQRRVGQARVARALASKRFLAPGLKETEARDIVYALMSIDTYRILRVEQGWSGARYERWLASALYRLLVASSEV
ncbi:MAG TPA: helix-turn-helix domain-containing protein [Acidimicrobiia bacterium]|jgi:AcrR family transcriptional regulator|nr:helix-turn-helix domain-containing protein [Acidimicrobiia bacterium]